ncbi:type II secretion system secretin GspD [Pollutimonas bauzanensis]|uniref:Type II secretion system protein D (GspD) n=1 Tax=Pollutimonas bauzanensis TaxID=658167 RepID=A0A1M5NUK2_9BURK|nr:type II secretion system secretin GspD [Pollutimonas bauzanensis]SHG93266.1 type II secretion system protein D (GspD) [Pollutimonas bauzanensis]
MKNLKKAPQPGSALCRAGTVSALAVALAGCGTALKPPADAGLEPSSLVVHTASGQGWRQEGRPGATPVAAPIPPRARSRAGAAPAASPAPQAGAPGQEAPGGDIMLNFVDAELQGVVRALARFTGRNFVVDPRIKGQLTLVSEAPVDRPTAYAMLLGALRMQGFAVVDVGGVSRVVPEADAKLQGSPVASGAQAGARGGSELMTRVFPLRYENAVNLVPVLRPMIAPNNPINAYAGNNTLVITDYADNLERIAQVIAGIDTPSSINTDVIPIQYGVALDVAALASQLLDAKASGDASQQISIVADPRSNNVLVRAGSPARLELARDLIQRIDSPETRAGNLHVVYLRNAQAARLAEVLRGALTGQGASGSASGGASTGTSGGLSGGMASSASATGLSGLGTTTASSGSASRRTSALGSAGASSALGGADSANTQSLAFSAGGATVQADPSTNTLIISAPDPLYRSLREVIDQLDQRRAQVLVESLIVEVNADNAAEFGIQWMLGGSDISSGKTSFIGGANLGGSGISSGGATTIDALGQGLNLGIVKGTVNILGNEVINLGMLARAMQTQGGANVLSTPNLMTLDNEEASIVVGRTVPFVTGQYTTAADGASNPFQTIEREDVGLTLRIRPQISEGGTVKLALYQEVSSIDTSASTSTSGLVTRKRALETNVLVDDGQIIVLGGLLEDTVSDSTTAVPLLSDIPIIGNLFRYDSRTRSKTNLMVFLRPHIVRNAQDGASVTLDRYNYMRAAQARLPLRSTWLAPDATQAALPDIERNPDTGLLDLRDPAAQNPAPAPGAAGPAEPTAAPRPARKWAPAPVEP